VTRTPWLNARRGHADGTRSDPDQWRRPPRYITLYVEVKGRQRSTGPTPPKHRRVNAGRSRRPRTRSAKAARQRPPRSGKFQRYAEDQWLPHHRMEAHTREIYTQFDEIYTSPTTRSGHWWRPTSRPVCAGANSPNCGPSTSTPSAACSPCRGWCWAPSRPDVVAGLPPRQASTMTSLAPRNRKSYPPHPTNAARGRSGKPIGRRHRHTDTSLRPSSTPHAVASSPKGHRVRTVLEILGDC
jgi:hypothetical protein